MERELRDHAFMFATGIECSYPTIAGTDGKTRRVDELETTFHYKYWRDDLRLVHALGIRYLRYGPPYYKMHLAPGRYDWSFSDDVFDQMRWLGVEPIADLCHFGVPDWIENFQNPEWPELFAEYAAAFARRYPWARFYTPVNEIFVCAKLSALHGLWNERLRSERGFVTALKHLCRANLLATQAILGVRPDAIVVQSESAEYFHTACQDEQGRRKADFENQRRFLSFDLLYAHPVRDDVRMYLREQGMTDAEYDWFMQQNLADRSVMGNDYYQRNEQLVMSGGAIQPSGEIFGWMEITRQYYDRYHRPVMHTETNNIGHGAEFGPRWLWKEFLNVLHLRERGVPVIGFTWFSLQDQVDWDIAMASVRRLVNPVGLYDLDRRARPVARAYQQLLQEFKGLPAFPGDDERGGQEGYRATA
ncbi:MAG: family 1 glycosylhydrolase [Chloroflexota bacterium]|nr:family 1 glycosylhydrolase [Chloroflexota bacterium]